MASVCIAAAGLNARFPAASTVLVRDVATATVVSRSMSELVPGDYAKSRKLPVDQPWLVPEGFCSGHILPLRSVQQTFCEHLLVCDTRRVPRISHVSSHAPVETPSVKAGTCLKTTRGRKRRLFITQSNKDAGETREKKRVELDSDQVVLVALLLEISITIGRPEAVHPRACGRADRGIALDRAQLQSSWRSHQSMTQAPTMT